MLVLLAVILAALSEVDVAVVYVTIGETDEVVSFCVAARFEISRIGSL